MTKSPSILLHMILNNFILNWKKMFGVTYVESKKKQNICIIFNTWEFITSKKIV